jgi:hypothetical protein
MCISWTNKKFYIINARCNHEDYSILLRKSQEFQQLSFEHEHYSFINISQ